jgi:hypothetical protein
VEKLQFALVGVILLFLLVAVVIAVEAQAWVDLATGFSNVGRIPEGIEFTVLLGALAFAGAGGTLNLVQSNWIRDKGLGMGVHIPRIVSPLTGQEEAMVSTGFFFPQDEANLNRWKGWWRVANHEQFWTFGVIGAVSIILLSVLTYSTIGTGNDVEGFDFIRLQGEELSAIVAPWFGQFFWLTGMVVLLSTNLGVLDHVGRLTADVLKVGFLRDNEFWTESKIYFAVVWLEVLFGSVILLSGVTQPIVLLVIASALNGFVMFVYSVLLIQLNRFTMPKGIRLGGVRLAVMGWSVLFFGFFSAIAIISEGSKLFE